MHLLITNTQEDQAYLILLCLKDEASKVVVTLGGETRFQRWFGISRWSRHVSKRYRVPDVYADWKAGVVQFENTPAEERYIQRIEEICVEEAIDTIFPSYDPEVYVFSKNKARLAEQGILAVVPDYDALTRILDKSMTLEAARKVGFPTPASELVSSLESLSAARAKIDGPWVLKPRCNAHGRNIVLVEEPALLEQVFSELHAIQEVPMLQEYVQEQTKRNYYVVVDRDSELVSVFSPIVSRTRRTGDTTHCAAVESCSDVPHLTEIRDLIREIGIWGGMTIQTIVDARDGKPKILEINPRFGNNLWFRMVLGLNEPLMFLRIARGESPGDVPGFREPVILLDPLSDFIHLLGLTLDQGMAYFRAKIQGVNDEGGSAVKESIPQLLSQYKAEYFSRRARELGPLNKGFFSDPLPPLVRIARDFLRALQRLTS